MEQFFLGFLTGGSLILAIGPQNLFVIEQGLKKNHTFIVCFICTVSDLLFIFLGIFLFSIFNLMDNRLNNILNVLLLIFIGNFIWGKIKTLSRTGYINKNLNREKIKTIILKTLAFTYLNPHVYSDTIFIIGGFSKSLVHEEKLFFGIGASLASLIYFFSLGYSASYFSQRLNNQVAWLYINLFIIVFMSSIFIYVGQDIVMVLYSIIPLEV